MPNSECNNCTKTDAALNKDILRAFLVNDDATTLHIINTLPFEVNHIANFTVFVEEHLKEAHKTAEKLAELETQQIVDILSDVKNRYPISAYPDYLSRITLFKHAATRNVILPPASQVRPDAFFSEAQQETPDQLYSVSDVVTTTVGSPASLDPEYKLAWWREDPALNEHHYNWHVYYPTDKTVWDRQGELFAYMHEQMLARYNFERLAVGLAPVVPYGPGNGWDLPLVEGYNPDLKEYSYRPANMTVPQSVNFNSTRIIIKSAMETNRERLHIAMARDNLEKDPKKGIQEYEKPEGIDMHDLGCTVEANSGSVNKKLYGNIHNNGHLMLALINDPDKRFGIKFGPMYDTLTAIRDSVFFRWHTYIDKIFEELRQNMEPYGKKDMEIPSIKLNDISVISDSDDHLKNICEEDRQNQLYTWMHDEKLTIYLKGKTPTVRTITQTVMQYVPFTYHFKVSNTGTEDALLVFRVFLAPVQYSTDLDNRRTTFVELDCFVEEVKGGHEKTVIRMSKDSSVLMPPQKKVEDIDKGDLAGSESLCGCGWPRHLLIPRGTSAGMKSDLFVLVTDWNKDAVEPSVHLTGNVAYCGKKDSKYPDKQPMGFPFDRKMSESYKTLEEMVGDLGNCATARVDITYMENK